MKTLFLHSAGAVLLAGAAGLTLLGTISAQPMRAAFCAQHFAKLAPTNQHICATDFTMVCEPGMEPVAASVLPLVSGKKNRVSYLCRKPIG